MGSVGEGLSTGEKSTSTKGEVGPLLSLLRKKVCSVELSLPSKLKFIFSLSMNILPITIINILKFGLNTSTKSLNFHDLLGLLLSFYQLLFVIFLYPFNELY